MFEKAIKRALKVVKCVAPIVAVIVFILCVNVSDIQTALKFAVLDTLLVSAWITILIVEFCCVYCVNPKFWDSVHELLKNKPTILRLLSDVKVLSGNAELVDDSDEKELFKLFKSEIEKQGVLEVWTSNPKHFCKPAIEPAIYLITAEDRTFDGDVLGGNWCIPEKNIWNEPMSLSQSTRSDMLAAGRRMYKIYDRGVWFNCAYIHKVED